MCGLDYGEQQRSHWFMKVWDIVFANKLSEDILNGEISGYESKFVERWFSFL